MDSELLVKSIRYFSDYTSALSRSLLCSFRGQPLSKQLYMDGGLRPEQKGFQRLTIFFP